MLSMIMVVLQRHQTLEYMYMVTIPYQVHFKVLRLVLMYQYLLDGIMFGNMGFPVIVNRFHLNVMVK
jgi:hypothetical protein